MCEMCPDLLSCQPTHCGGYAIGRQNVAEILADPAYSHVYFDISWDEVAKYIVSSPEATKVTADLINRYPDRFLFGTDEVAPTDQAKYLKIYDMYAPLFAKLTPEARVCGGGSQLSVSGGPKL